MLNNDAAVFAEMFGRISRQNSNVVQSVGAGRERADGFKAKCFKVFVVFFDVRRVGDDEIEFLVGKGAKPVAFDKRHFGAECFGVAFGDDQGILAFVAGPDLSLGTVKRNRHGNAAAAGTEIKHAGRFKILEKCQSLFDERFGVRARNERSGRDVKGAPPEFLRTDDVWNGFACLSSLQARKQRVKFEHPRVCIPDV